MGSVNSLPVVSQVKSGVLYAYGEKEEAKEVQKEFVHECPGASQVTSLVYLHNGEKEKAIETQKKCAESVANFIDGVPLIGHVKGAVHYTRGESEACEHSIKAATRTSAVIGGAMGGSLVAGPIGAVGGALAAATACDGAVTAIDSNRHGEYRPSGVLASVQEVKKDPSVGKVFDSVTGVVLDGALGYYVGSSAEVGPAKMTRSQWRNWQRRAANARNAGRAPVPKPVSNYFNVPKWRPIFQSSEKPETEHKPNNSKL